MLNCSNPWALSTSLCAGKPQQHSTQSKIPLIHLIVVFDIKTASEGLDLSILLF
jgi:hypothetical protein